MSCVNLRFPPDMVSAVLSGRVISATRKEEQGRVGDTFSVGPVLYRIVEIWELDLEGVIHAFYRLEGFASKDEFWAFWQRIYPQDWTGKEKVFTYFFAAIKEPGMEAVA